MTKELEQRISVLENEFKIIDSYIDNLKLYHDEQVKSLETELNESEQEIIKLENKLNNLKYYVNDLELQHEYFRHHDFTEDDLITFKKLLDKHIFEVEYNYRTKSSLNSLLNKVKNILNSKYGIKE